MEINPTAPGTHMCIDTLPVYTVKEGKYIVFYALDIYEDKILSFEIMPDALLRDYIDFVTLLSRKASLRESVLILDFYDKHNNRETLLDELPFLKDVICDTSLCHTYTKDARNMLGERFGLK